MDSTSKDISSFLEKLRTFNMKTTSDDCKMIEYYLQFSIRGDEENREKVSELIKKFYTKTEDEKTGLALWLLLWFKYNSQEDFAFALRLLLDIGVRTDIFLHPESFYRAIIVYCLGENRNLSQFNYDELVINYNKLYLPVVKREFRYRRLMPEMNF